MTLNSHLVYSPISGSETCPLLHPDPVAGDGGGRAGGSSTLASPRCRHTPPRRASGVAAAILPAQVRDAPLGSVAEVSPASVALVADISTRLLTQGGAALLIDYGSDIFGARDTLQAVAHHKPHPALEAPGTADLCAHVDFAMLAQAAAEQGASVWGPVTQGLRPSAGARSQEREVPLTSN